MESKNESKFGKILWTFVVIVAISLGAVYAMLLSELDMVTQRLTSAEASYKVADRDCQMEKAPGCESRVEYLQGHVDQSLAEIREASDRASLVLKLLIAVPIVTLFLGLGLQRLLRSKKKQEASGN